MRMNSCAARGCNAEVPANRLMCRSHWFQVPKSLRDRVWSQYSAMHRNVPGAAAEYRSAREEAINSVPAVVEVPADQEEMDFDEAA